MNEELGYEVTPKQSLDGLWRTMHKYIEQHGYSDISLEIEGLQYEFRQHLQKYDEYEAKAKAFDHIENLVKTELTIDDLYNDARNNDYAAGMLRVYERVDYLIDEYESGESDA